MWDQQSLRSACTYAQSDQSLCLSLEYSMTVKLLTEIHLEFLSLKAGCRGSSESTLVKIPHCWKSHVTAHFMTINIFELKGDLNGENHSGVFLFLLGIYCHKLKQHLISTRISCSAEKKYLFKLTPIMYQ